MITFKPSMKYSLLISIWRRVGLLMKLKSVERLIWAKIKNYKLLSIWQFSGGSDESSPLPDF